jgi:signal transduction histidine kinase
MPGRRGECLSLALPVGSIRYPVGILLAYYRLINTEKWLPAVGAHGDTRFYFLNLQGQPVSGTNPPAVPPPLRDRAFLRQAAQEKQGTRIFSPDRGTNRRLVAFALASRPRWLVSVGQSLPSALETIHFMSWRLALLSLPILALPLITAVVLVRQFRIQETLTARLEAQNRQLKTEEQAKSDFLAHVSHDLWTPLASVQLSLSSMLDPNVTWTPAESHRSLRLALGETERLIGRVRNLLEMARLDINDSTLPKEPCVLQDIVEAILERMKPLLQQHPVEQVFPEEPLLIEGRPAQIEVVLMNLLENALKYSPAGTPLHLGAQCRREEVYFTLRDHGPGAPREVRDRIFDPFFRTQKEGSRSGVGLGLALCRKIIEKHGGLIGVMNAPEGGAIFWFTLPLLPSQGVDWQ